MQRLPTTELARSLAESSMLSVPDELLLCDRALSAISHGVFIVDTRTTQLSILYANEALLRMTGLKIADLEGHSLFDIYSQLDPRTISDIHHAIRIHSDIHLVFQNARHPDEKRWLELSLSPIAETHGLPQYYVGSLRDVSERQLVEEQLVKQATHDTLTNLPNRSALIERFSKAMHQAINDHSLLALAFLDLDHFKLINDSLGHNIGDKLLLAVTNRLIVSTREFDTVSRISGDEFVIMLPNLSHEAEASAIVARLLKNIHQPFHIEQQDIMVSASIGVSFFPKDGSDYSTLLKNADLSMYQAKNAGRNNFQCFDKKFVEPIQGFIELEHGLRNALEKQEMSIDYQPVISLHDNHIHGTEALMRWNHGESGRISPLKFIPVAEEIDLISELSEWLLQAACRQHLNWHKKYSMPTTLSVNLSGKQIQQKNFVDVIKILLTETEFPPEMLELELTESLLITAMDDTIQCMNRLKNLGITLSIDDFGTGYSSLAYLKKFPVDNLKIDRSFISCLGEDQRNGDIIKTIIQLAHQLKLCVIAEGVETQEQLNFLKASECDFGQGYFFYKPMGPGEIEKILREGQTD